MGEVPFAMCCQALEAGQSRSSPLLKRPVRTQAVIDQSDMYTHVLSVFTEKDVPHKFVIAVLMEYIRSLNQFQITVQVPSDQHVLSQVREAGASLRILRDFPDTTLLSCGGMRGVDAQVTGTSPRHRGNTYPSLRTAPALAPRGLSSGVGG